MHDPAKLAALGPDGLAVLADVLEEAGDSRAPWVRLVAMGGTPDRLVRYDPVLGVYTIATPGGTVLAAIRLRRDCVGIA